MTFCLADIWMPPYEHLRLAAPEFVLIGSIVAVLLAPLLSRSNGRNAALIALLGCVVCAVTAYLTMDRVSDGGLELFGVWKPDAPEVAGAGMLLADRLSSFFRLFLMVFLAAIIGMWLMFDADRERHPTEFFVLLLTSALGMALMTGTTNLLMMVIAIEMASLPSYALAGFDKFRRIASEASVKYVIFGASTSGFMIYGVSLLYGMFGTLHIPTLIARMADYPAPGPLLAIALLAVFAGIAFKISAVPFHFWCPDVFEGASLAVATWLSVASKAAGLVLLLRFVFLMAGESGDHYSATVLPIVQYGVGIFAILTCTWANLAAYRQTNVRRMLAYSSIAHAGYMLMAGAVVTRLPGFENALSAVVAYLLVYLFMNLGAFLTIGLVASDTGSEDLKAFSNLGFRDPVTAASMTVCLVSLVGLPPLGGFIVKWWLLAALGGAASYSGPAGAVSHVDSAFLWLLVVVVALNTAISLYYYARVVWQMYFVPGESAPVRAAAMGKVTVAICALVLIITGTIGIRPLKERADAFVDQLYVPPPAGFAEPVHAAAAAQLQNEPLMPVSSP